MSSHILIVEDDASLAEWLADYLSGQGYTVTTANRGDIAVAMIKEDDPDLVLLDINLPGLDGLQVCKQVRGFYSNPILMLTAFSEEADEVLGLEMGADDYLGKPVRARALLARVRALLRRGSETQQAALVFGNLKIDPNNRNVTVNNNLLNINPNEFEVLWLLAKQVGKVTTRDDLLQTARGIEYDGFDRSIDIRISRLRKRLAEAKDCGCAIKTVRGKGYMFIRED